MALMASMSAGWPYSDTGRMARVRGPMRAAISAGSRLPLSGSASANTGRAPSSTMASAVAMKENGVVMTSSPGSTPSAMSEISSASVPEDTVMQWRAPQNAARLPSNCATSGPMMYWPWSSTRWMPSLMLSRSS